MGPLPKFSSTAYQATRCRLRARFGEHLEPWWAALPAVVAQLSARWGLVVHSPVGGGNRGLVAIDPRPCVGEPAFDAAEWVFWNADPAG